MPIAQRVQRERTGLGLALCALLSLVALTGCGPKSTWSVDNPPPHSSYQEVLAASQKYASLEVEQLTTGYFGDPLFSTKGAHVATPVPLYEVSLDADETIPLLSRVDPLIRNYSVPVLNLKGEILGEYGFYLTDQAGWEFRGAGREGDLTDAVRARALLGVSPDTSVTLIVSGANWSVVSSGTAERGVALRVPGDYGHVWTEAPVAGRVYEGDALRHWFTPQIRR